MNWIGWSAVIISCSTAYLYIGFMALCTAKRMRAAAKKHGFDLPWEMKVVCIFVLITAWPTDVIYNWSVGNWRFKFWRFNTPWRITYSSRIQWNMNHLERSNNPSQALRWTILLNAGDDGHIDTRISGATR